MAADTPDTPSSRNITRQPVVIALAVAAALGWTVAIWSLIASSTQEREFTQRIQQLEAGRATTVSQLEELRRTGGTLADLQGQTRTAQSSLEQATAALARTRDELGPAEQRLKDLEAQVEARTARAAGLQGQTETLTRQLEQARQELATIQQTIGTRTQELAAVGERLVRVRQEETQARQEFSRLAAASAEKVAETGDAERRLQEAREAEAQAQRNLAAARTSLAELERTRTETARIVDEITANRNQVIAELQQARQQSAAVQRQLAGLIDQLTARRNELTAIDQRLQDGPPEAQSTQAASGQEGSSVAAAEGRATPAPTDAGQQVLGCAESATGWVCSAPQEGSAPQQR
jgi:chromosome segregation ATPase